MAVTRSSSANKVVRKAVAVKVTKASGRKYVSWDDSYNQLLALSKKEGHCRPHFSSMLGKWCAQQRVVFQANLQANKPLLHQYQIKKLSTIGFQFCLRNKKPKKNLKWDDRYEELVDYKNEHGHANPLQSDGQLGRWRHLCRTCKLCRPWRFCQTLMLLPSNKKGNWVGLFWVVNI